MINHFFRLEQKQNKHLNKIRTLNFKRNWTTSSNRIHVKKKKEKRRKIRRSPGNQLYLFINKHLNISTEISSGNGTISIYNPQQSIIATSKLRPFRHLRMKLSDGFESPVNSQAAEPKNKNFFIIKSRVM